MSVSKNQSQNQDSFLGREVSCRVLGFMFDELEDSNESLEGLARGTGYPLEHLRDRQRRISWSSYCVLMANAARLWSDSELEAMGFMSMQTRWARPFTIPGRVLFSPADFYRWMASPNGVARQMFTCVRITQERTDSKNLTIRFTMAPGFAPCREYFVVTRGTLRGLPRLLGLPEARVEMQESEEEVRFQVQLPPGGGILAAVARTLTSPFTARAAAQELKEAYQVLHQRYADLEREISERKRAEEEVRSLNAELEQRVHERTQELLATNRELESFAYSVAHDLRAPLRAINGFTTILGKDYTEPSNEQAQGYLSRVRSASRRMDQLIDDLLALSQVSRGELHLSRVDLSAIAREVISDLRDREPGRAGRFEIADELEVVGDGRLVRVALENLLANAWKFTRYADEPKIEVGATRGDGDEIFFVKDNGIGFDARYAERMFEVFHRLHDEPEIEGTGIGLATVRRIVERHHGRIWAEGEPQKGATFFLALPSPKASASA